MAKRGIDKDKQSGILQNILNKAANTGVSYMSESAKQQINIAGDGPVAVPPLLAALAARRR